MEGFLVEICSSVVTGRHGVASDLELANNSAIDLFAGVLRDDADLKTRNRRAQPDEFASGRVVCGKTAERFGKRHRDRCLGHPVGTEDCTTIEPVPFSSGGEDLHRVGVDRIGSVKGKPTSRKVEAICSGESACGERIGEVRSRRHGAAVVGEPLKPPERFGQEILRSTKYDLGACDHRQAAEPYEAHVVVQRQPRDHHVVWT